MKDKIKQLSDKAKKSVPHGLTPDKWIEIYNEKFAELIVRECVRYFNEDYQRDFNTLWREDLSKSMKEHFGVEE